MQRDVIHKHYPGLPSDVTIIVNPLEQDFYDIRLGALYRRWMRDRSEDQGLVGREIIETPEFGALYRNVMLLEIERPTPFEFDFVYRIYGADIAKRYGRDMTDRRTSEFPGPVSKLFLDLYEMAIDRCQPIRSLHAPPVNVDVAQWERLILPLGQTQVDWILTVNIPSGRRSKGAEG